MVNVVYKKASTSRMYLGSMPRWEGLTKTVGDEMQSGRDIISDNGLKTADYSLWRLESKRNTNQEEKI